MAPLRLVTVALAVAGTLALVAATPGPAAGDGVFASALPPMPNGAPGLRLVCPTDMRNEGIIDFGEGDRVDNRTPLELMAAALRSDNLGSVTTDEGVRTIQGPVYTVFGQAFTDARVLDRYARPVGVFTFQQTRAGWQLARTYECSRTWSYEMGDVPTFPWTLSPQARSPANFPGVETGRSSRR